MERAKETRKAEAYDQLKGGEGLVVLHPMQPLFRVLVSCRARLELARYLCGLPRGDARALALDAFVLALLLMAAAEEAGQA
ncbi:MAG: hypothetical protein JXP34_12150 [Planctomycetes bacterium]|nr:hypothetical protein [Planctomycetota bacterium]